MGAELLTARGKLNLWQKTTSKVCFKFREHPVGCLWLQSGQRGISPHHGRPRVVITLKRVHPAISASPKAKSPLFLRIENRIFSCVSSSRFSRGRAGCRSESRAEEHGQALGAWLSHLRRRTTECLELSQDLRSERIELISCF